MPSIPVRNFGKHGDQISVLGLGGHHLGDAEDEQAAIQIVHEAVDGGITFFDNRWEHKDPAIHLKMLATGFPLNAVQMPLNAFDATFHSFETQVLPELNRRGIAALRMKPFSGKGEQLQKGLLTPGFATSSLLGRERRLLTHVSQLF
jgi:hypothetical protein